MVNSEAVQAHLAEYKILRAEISQYSQRIDRMVVVYLTVLVAASGFLLWPETPFDASDYIQRVESSHFLSGIFIFLSIVNTSILLRVLSFLLVCSCYGSVYEREGEAVSRQSGWREGA